MPRVSKCLNLGRVLWEGRRSNFPSALQHETSTTKLELSYAIPGEVEKNLPVENKGAYMPTFSRCLHHVVTRLGWLFQNGPFFVVRW